MLADIELLPIIEKANRLEKDALFEMAGHYLSGKKVPKNAIKAREMLWYLVVDEEKDYNDFEYGAIYTSLADIYHFEKNYHFAYGYYNKARDFILDYYPEEKAKSLIKKYDLEAMIEETKFM